jgi:hypothetical protein
VRAPLHIDRRVVVWFVAGLVMAAFLQVVQARALGGGPDALLSVGADSALRPIIEDQLGPVVVTEGVGHDGQTAFVVATDPLGRGPGAEALDHAGFRYRRILYPALAGGFGVFAPGVTVVGLAVIGALGFALGVAAVADVAVRMRGWDRLALAAMLAPGLWLSVRLSTVDALAVGLMLVALALWDRNAVPPAALVMAASVLTKEQMLVTAVALAAYALWRGRARDALIMVGAPVLALVVWSAAVSVLVGDGFAARGNLALPFLGIADAAATWPSTPMSDRILVAITLTSLVVGAGAAWWARATAFGWVLGVWILLAVVGSTWVWDFGNNAARVYVAVIPLTALAVARQLMPAHRSPERRRA